MKKLIADTITGIVEVEEFEMIPTSENFFVTSLKDLQDGETICAEVSDQVYNLIFETYGVRK